MAKALSRAEARKIRHRRIRKKLTGTIQRPRLPVFRSSRHIYVSAVDDEAGHTLVAANTLQIKETLKVSAGNKDAAYEVGKVVAQKLQEQSISEVVFDRGGYLYHGRVKSLAEGAREGGLKF